MLEINSTQYAGPRSIYHGLFSLVVCLGVGVFDRIAPNGLAVVVVLVVSTARFFVLLARDEGGESGGASFLDALDVDRPFFPVGARLVISLLAPTSSSGLRCCFLTGNLAASSI